MGVCGDILTRGGLRRLLIIIVSALLSQAYTSICCTQTERAALLQIKSFFLSAAASTADYEYVYGYLSSWSAHGNNSCCSWDEVTCDKPMQHVTELYLIYLTTFGPFNWKGNVLNVTLFQPFEKLTSLHLSGNSFQRLEGSEALSNLKKLRVLDLRDNSLSGSIQSQGLCNLKYVRELYIANNDLSGSLPRCLGYLTSLQLLDLSSNNLSGDVPTFMFSNLTSLKSLDLSKNHFQGELYLNDFLNHSELEVLRLSSSGLQVKIEDTLLPSSLQLKQLELSDCSLYLQDGVFQQFLLKQQQLLWLDISHNSLHGSFPTWILDVSFRNIQGISLRNNSFEGILRLPVNAKTESLLYFDISGNHIYGNFLENISSVMPRLEYLNASKNSFDGRIPASIGNMTGLRFLDLSNNNLFGEVPSKLFTKFFGLEILKLSSNYLQGDIIPDTTSNKMIRLYLDNNFFGGTIRQSHLNIANSLECLDISDNEVVGGIPSWIGNMSSLRVLSMANNKLHGPIPSELCNLQELEYLDLSNNHLKGVIPTSYNLKMVQILSLHSNFLTGSLPIALSKSSELVALDLSENHFSGFIPMWINHMSRLNILLLRQNWLEGELPIQLCSLQHINMLDLSNNNIFGAIPSCLANMSFGNISTLFYPESGTSVSLPVGISLEELAFFSIQTGGNEEVTFFTKSRYDTYKGYSLGHMSGLDLSCNQLIGSIPQELGRSEYIISLNLSHNQLSGSIPNSFSMLRSIESLDLSYNHLSGAIPWQLAEVTTLEKFNVSYNNLSGEVPETGQFASFDENNYMGNPFLHGSFLNRRHAATPSTPDKKETGDTVVDFDWEVFFWSFGMSGSIVMVACIMVLWINPYWRRAWFQFVEFHVLWRFI